MKRKKGSRSKRSIGRNRLREPSPPLVAADDSASIALNSHLHTDGEFWVPDSGEHCYMTMMSILKAIEMTRDNDSTRILCLFGSSIAVVFPELKEVIVDVLAQQGIRLKELKIPSQAAPELVQEDPPLYEFLTVFGQLVIMVYRPSTTENLSQFMSQIIEGLRPVVETPSSIHTSDLFAIVDVAKVEKIRSVFGNHHDFRFKLLYKVVDLCDDSPVESFCRHVAEILEFTDMDSFQLIFDTIPSLRHLHPAVRTEVDNIVEATRYVTSVRHPQYFGIIMKEPSARQQVDSARFPILAAVSQKLKKYCSSTSNIRFRPSSNINIHMVNTLIEKVLTLKHGLSCPEESEGSNYC